MPHMGQATEGDSTPHMHKKYVTCLGASFATLNLVGSMRRKILGTFRKQMRGPSPLLGGADPIQIVCLTCRDSLETFTRKSQVGQKRAEK